jgi:hypothetical protein
MIIGSKESFIGSQQSDAPMFRTEISPEGSFLGWVLQQTAAPLPLVFWALLVSPEESAIAPWLGDSGRQLSLFLVVVPGWILSLFLAICIQRSFPRAVVLGRWIWVLPVSALALAFCWDAAHFSFSFAFAEYFYPGPDGESALAFALMTCPAISAIAYSLGMIFSARGQKLAGYASKASATRNSWPGDA